MLFFFERYNKKGPINGAKGLVNNRVIHEEELFTKR